jgi:hypothetical protein
VVDEVGESLRWDRPLVVEVDGLEDAMELFGVGVRDAEQRIVHGLAEPVLVSVADVRPEAAIRDEQVVICVRVRLNDLHRVRDLGELVQGFVGLFSVAIARSFEEQQREDVILRVRDLVAGQVLRLPQVVAERLGGERYGRVDRHIPARSVADSTVAGDRHVGPGRE